MSLPRPQRLEHVELAVTDFDAAVAFYTDVMGLVEIERDDETVYLGCGMDENYDLALCNGGTGVEHFALRVSESELVDLEDRLRTASVETERFDEAEPNQSKAVRFDLPSGVSMELAVVADTDYTSPSNPAHSRTTGIAPLDIDHINLMAPDVKTDAEFLRDTLGFNFSDITEPEPDFWSSIWTRFGEYHHDVGITMTENPDADLHHVAWTLSNFEHMKRSLDILSDAGYPIEFGPSRHPVGSNLFAYFWGPAGNRIELSAEMAVLDPDTDTGVWEGMEGTLDAWRDVEPPDSFLDGS